MYAEMDDRGMRSIDRLCFVDGMHAHNSRTMGSIVVRARIRRQYPRRVLLSSLTTMPKSYRIGLQGNRFVGRGSEGEKGEEGRHDCEGERSRLNLPGERGG